MFVFSLCSMRLKRRGLGVGPYHSPYSFADLLQPTSQIGRDLKYFDVTVEVNVSLVGLVRGRSDDRAVLNPGEKSQPDQHAGPSTLSFDSWCN
jgi:hypothetical protein